MALKTSELVAARGMGRDYIPITEYVKPRVPRLPSRERGFEQVGPLVVFVERDGRISLDNLMLEPVPINGSGDIRLGLHANALAHHPLEISELNPGRLINYYKL